MTARLRELAERWADRLDRILVRAALTHFAKGSEVGGDAEDAARWRFLRNQAVDGFMRLASGPSLNCDEPEREWDSWIDAARKGERHE